MNKDHKEFFSYMAVLIIMSALAISYLASSCALTKQQKMERDMFDPKPTKYEKKQMKQWNSYHINT